MTQPQSPRCSPREPHTPRLRISPITPVEEQDKPTDDISFTSFAESLAELDTATMILSTGASAQAVRRTTIANHAAPATAGAHAPPSSSPWLLNSPNSIDDLLLVLRWGEVARAGRRRGGHHRHEGTAATTAYITVDARGEGVAGHGPSYVAYRPPGVAPVLLHSKQAERGGKDNNNNRAPPGPRPGSADGELFFFLTTTTGFTSLEARVSLPAPLPSDDDLSTTSGSHETETDALPVSPMLLPSPAAGASTPAPFLLVLPAPPARRDSASSLLSIQKTIFHIRRPSDARWGCADAGGQGEPKPATEPAAVVGCRADLPSERRRLAGRRGY